MLRRHESYIEMTEKNNVIVGNGHGKWHLDISRWPWYAQMAWAACCRFGLATVFLVAGAGGLAWYQVKIGMPQSEANLNMIKATIENQAQLVKDQRASTENQNRLMTIVERVALNEQTLIQTVQSLTDMQRSWQQTALAQHEMRAKEAKLIIDHQIKAETFFERTDKLHSQQLDLLQGIMEELRAIRIGTLKNQLPPPATPGGEPKN